jgi:hypothetical protein
MLECVGQMILAANDVTDAQVGVVRARSQVIRRHAITAQQREILDVRDGFGLLAVNRIAKANIGWAIARHTEAQHERFAGGGAPVAFGSRQFAHVRIEKPSPFAARRFASIGLGRREVAVRQPLFEDRLSRGLVHRQPLGLAILFVPTQIEPAQPVEDGIERRLRVAFDVGIVDAQDHRAAIVARVKPVEDERARAADMEKAGGGRREANS